MTTEVTERALGTTHFNASSPIVSFLEVRQRPQQGLKIEIHWLAQGNIGLIQLTTTMQSRKGSLLMK